MSNKLRVGFTGDLSFSGHFKGAHTDNDLFDNSIKDFFNSNDYNIINFESPITPCRITKKKRLAHRCPPEVLGFVKDNIPNPVLSFANNHMMDYGYIGLIDSMESAKQWDLPYIGAGINIQEACKYVILGDEVKVGILAVQYKEKKIAGKRYAGPLHESKVSVIKEQIRAIKQQADYAVMFYHGGDEFLHAPMPYIRKQLKEYLEWGCDIVVAHHPHVVQGYEQIGKKAIFYSLGNFVFDTNYQRAQEDTDQGVLLGITFDKNGFSFDSLSTWIDREERKILKCEDNEYFYDLQSVSYSRLWCTQAYRKKEILERAAVLRRADKKEARISRKAERKVVRKLRRTARRKERGEDIFIEEENREENVVIAEDELVGNEPDELDEELRSDEELENDEEFENDEELENDEEAENNEASENNEAIVNNEDVQGDGTAPQRKKKRKSKASMHVRLKKIHKKWFKNRQKKRRAFVVKMGGFTARLLYRNDIK